MKASEESAKIVESIRDAVVATEGRGLDDVTRQRVHQRLVEHLDEPPRNNVWPVRTAAAALLVAGLVGVVLWIGGRRAAPTPALTLKHVSNQGHGLEVGTRTDELRVPDGVSVKAKVGEQGEVEAIGPARVAVDSATPGAVTLRLERGLLRARVNPTGRRFEVRAADVRVVVVGTHFLVDLRGGEPAVAVAEGVVTVLNKGSVGPRSITLHEGQAWRTGQEAAGPVPPRLAAALGVKPKPDPQEEARRHPPVLSQPPDFRSSRPAGAPAPPELLYRRAEAALRSGDRTLARARLEQVVRRFPDDKLAASALYELAQLAVRDGNPKLAQSFLRRLQRVRKDPSLHEPAHFLSCRIAVESGAMKGALECLQRFRRSYPSSPHDEEALYALIRLRLSRPGSCSVAAPLCDEYLRRYPKGDFARQVRRHRAECSR
jgi:TolA-binding protein